MIISNSLLLILALCNPFILQSKTWELNQLCQQTCWGFDCVKQKPTHAELCGKLQKNSKNYLVEPRLKCCSQYANTNITTTTTSKPCQEDAKSQFKEKKRKKKQEGWFLNDACQTACYILSCLFGMQPTEEELCQVLNNRYNECCSEKYSTTSRITDNTGEVYTELVLSDPDFSSASIEFSESDKETSSSTLTAAATTTATTTTTTSTTPMAIISVEENGEVDLEPLEPMEDEATPDIDNVAAKKTKKPRNRKPRPDQNRKSKNQKYMKIPDK